MRRSYNGPLDDMNHVKKFILDNEYPEIAYLTKDTYDWLKKQKHSYLAYITSDFKTDQNKIWTLKSLAKELKEDCFIVLVETTTKWGKLFAKENGVFEKIMPKLLYVEPKVPNDIKRYFFDYPEDIT